MFYEPNKGHGLPHDPFKAIVAPRPIGWISTRSLQGEVNLAPYSFFNAFSTHPFLVWFASGGVKDSVAFARDSGEFVAFWVKDGRVLAGMNVNVWDVNQHVQELIRSRARVDLSELADPDTALESMVAGSSTDN